jgi:hypothetical protein
MKWPGMGSKVGPLVDVSSEGIDVSSIIPQGLKKRDKSPMRKLTSIRDPAGKNRVIAIFDYWTQTALRPMHLFLIRK